MQTERDSLVLISADPGLVLRYKQACEYLLFEPRIFATLEELTRNDKCRPRTIVLDWTAEASISPAVLVQIRESLSKLKVLLIVNRADAAKAAQKSSGFRDAAWILKEDFIKTFLTEFYLFQSAYCEHFAILTADLFPDTMVYFNAYRYLPLNQKYFPVIHQDFVIGEKKYRRIEAAKVLFIERHDATSYSRYIEKYYDLFNVGLRKRARARMYQLLSSWRDNLLKALFHSQTIEKFSEENPDFILWLNEFINYTGSAKDSWSLFFELSQMSALRFENSQLELSISCHFTRHFGEDEMERIINLKALLTMARLTQNPLLYKKWLLNQGRKFEKEESDAWIAAMLQFEKHPLFLGSSLEAQDDYRLYCSQFVTKADSSFKDAAIVHVYWGEMVAHALLKSHEHEYSLEKFTEDVLINCKSDRILNEVWLEELRQFLLKTRT